MLAFASLAQGLTQTEFELDKNATNNLATAHQGTLKSQISSTTATTFDVCQLLANPGPGATILIDAEQMTIVSVTALPGTGSSKTGGCSFSNPADVALNVMRYTVTRAANSSTAASHPGASDVTLMTATSSAADDWSDVYESVQDDIDNGITENHSCANLGAVACAWDHDDFNVSVFTTGGSKDDLNINPIAGESGTGWKWTDSSVPPSDEILDAFAVKYSTAGQQLLFFGADRWSTNGAKDMGFWFFHDDVSLNADGTFSGTHTRPNPDPDGDPATDDATRGDILLLSTFTQGGAVTSIRVFEWVGTGGNTNGTLNSIGAFGDCVPGGGADNGCNTVSNTTVPSPWPYQGAGSTQVPGVIYTGGLAEGAIDLTALNLEGCFSSFMAETRSSPEAGAQLKDFALGSFEACGATITTDASDDEFEIGGSINDTATVNITGGGPAPTGFVDFYVCGPSAEITSCDDTGTAAGHVNLSTATVVGTDYTVTSDTVTPTSAGDYCFYAEYPAGQDTNYPDGAFLTDFSDECFSVTPKQPTISTQVNTEEPVSPGTEVYDTATLGNTAAPSNGTDGTITFNAYAPDDPTCEGTPVYTSVVAVNGDGPYDANDGDANADGVPAEEDDEFHPTAPGTYNWIASYAPDAGDVNNQAATTACGDAHESSVVRTLQPTMDTAQRFVPNDSATITVTDEAGDLDGSVVFELFVNDTDCSGTAAYTSDPIDIDTGTPNAGTAGPSKTVSSANTVAYDADGTTFSWVVTYTSDNTGHEGVSSPCTNETSSIAIDNGAQQPEPAAP